MKLHDNNQNAGGASSPVSLFGGKVMTMTKSVAFLMCCVSTAALFAGNVCTWQGGSGKLSDANWADNAPVSGNGDTIYIDTTDGNPITIENDIADDFSLAKIQFAYKDIGVGSCGQVTFTGKSMNIVSSSASSYVLVWDNGDSTTAANRGPKVVVNVPVRFTKYCRVNASRALTFNKKVTIDDNGSVRLQWPVRYESTKEITTFNDEVYGPNAEIDNSLGSGGQGTTVNYNGKVTLKTFRVNHAAYAKNAVYLKYRENDISAVYFRYAYLGFDSSPSLGSQTVVTLPDDQYSSDGTIYINGSDVVCNRIECPGTRHPAVAGPASGSSTLTMRASADAVSGAKFGRNLSIVYDPQGAYTYKLANSASTMPGKLELKGGMFKLTGTTVFSALSEVIVRDGATLDLSECTEAPFASTTRLTVDQGGTVVLAAGQVVTFARGVRGGLPLSADDYSTGWVQNGTVTISNGPEAGVSWWASPADGDWNVAANWIPAGVPGADDEARIIAQGASGYTVRMTGAETKPAKIVVGTELEAKATLSVAGEANFTEHTRIEVNKGGEIVVPSGGKFIYDMATCTVKHDQLIKVTNGRFVVDGGYATLTNSYGIMVLSGAGAEMLVENGGELVLSDRASGADHALLLNKGTTLRMTSGSISLPSKYWNSIINQRSAKFDFSGGVFRLIEYTETHQFMFSGDTTFSQSAQWNVVHRSGGVRVTVAPRYDNEKMTFAALDDVTWTGHNLFFLTIGGLGAGRDTSFLWGASGSLGTDSCYVGSSKGTGRLCQTNGYFRAGARGLLVGNSGGVSDTNGSDASDNAVVGTVELSNGAMAISGDGAVHATWGWARPNSAPNGTILGYGGTLHPPASGRPYVGRMTISGTGSFTNECGHLFVGVAPCGDGSLVMTGGVLRSGTRLASFPAYQERIGFAVGVGGGKGEFRVGGGYCAISNNVWIGGVSTNSVRIMADGEKQGCRTYGYPFDVHDGEGLFEVSGGSVSLGRDLVVGSEGTGVVSVVGSRASQFTVGRNMVLSNEAAFVEGGAETAVLKFTPDAGGVTPITVAGRLVVSDTARLVVDVTGIDLKSAGTIPLVKCSSVEGNFGEGRIVVEGGLEKFVKVRRNGIFLRRPRGFTIDIK